MNAGTFDSDGPRPTHLSGCDGYFNLSTISTRCSSSLRLPLAVLARSKGGKGANRNKRLLLNYAMKSSVSALHLQSPNSFSLPNVPPPKHPDPVSHFIGFDSLQSFLAEEDEFLKSHSRIPRPPNPTLGAPPAPPLHHVTPLAVRPNTHHYIRLLPPARSALDLDRSSSASGGGVPSNSHRYFPAVTPSPPNPHSSYVPPYHECQQIRSTIALDFSPDGTLLATTHGDHTVKILDALTLTVSLVLVGHPRTPWTVKFNPVRQNLLASGCLGKEVRLWSLPSGSCLHCVYLAFSVLSLAFHPAGDLLAAAVGRNVSVWNWDTNRLETRSFARQVRCVGFTPCGGRLLVGEPVPFQAGDRGNGAPTTGPSATSAPATFDLNAYDFDGASFKPSYEYLRQGEYLSSIADHAPPLGAADRANLAGTWGSVGSLDNTVKTATGGATTSGRGGREVQPFAPSAFATQPINILHRALLYNDGGYDLSKEGYLCACAELWESDEGGVYEDSDDEREWRSSEEEGDSDGDSDGESYEDGCEDGEWDKGHSIGNDSSFNSSVGTIGGDGGGRSIKCDERVGDSRSPQHPPHSSLLLPDVSYSLSFEHPPPPPPARNPLPHPLDSPAAPRNVDFSSPPMMRRARTRPSSLTVSSFPLAPSSSSLDTADVSEGGGISASFPPPPLVGATMSTPAHATSDALHIIRGAGSLRREAERLRKAERQLFGKPLAAVEAPPLPSDTPTSKPRDADALVDLLAEIELDMPQNGRYVAHIVVVKLADSSATLLHESLNSPLSDDSSSQRIPPPVSRLILQARLPEGRGVSVTCVKFSPTMTYLVAGYGIRLGGDEPGAEQVQHPIATIFDCGNAGTNRRRKESGAREMGVVSTIWGGDDDVNLAMFHPLPGRGLVLGMKQGKVRVVDSLRRLRG